MSPTKVANTSQKVAHKVYAAKTRVSAGSVESAALPPWIVAMIASREKMSRLPRGCISHGTRARIDREQCESSRIYPERAGCSAPIFGSTTLTEREIDGLMQIKASTPVGFLNSSQFRA